MEKIKVENGKARPVNMHMANGEAGSFEGLVEWSEFESTVQWHDCPEATEDKEYWGVLTWKLRDDWKERAMKGEIDGYNIWLIVSQPQEKKTMEKIAVKITNYAQFNIFESERLRLGYKRFKGSTGDIIGWYGFEYDWSCTALGSEKAYLKEYKLIGFKEWDELYKFPVTKKEEAKTVEGHQAFENYPNLAEHLQNAACHWKVDMSTWTGLLEEINIVCSQNTALMESVIKILEQSRIEAMKNKSHAGDYAESMLYNIIEEIEALKP